MPGAEFANLASQLLEAMGLAMASVRQVPEGMLVKTSDGFLYAILEDPSEVSLGFVQRLGLEVGEEGSRLVLLTRGRLPLALVAEVARKGGTVVDSSRFLELVRGLGLAALLGEEPRGAAAPTSSRLLPSARQLDAMMERARTWGAWGVPALALRFYRQAATMKPEFLPARNGIAEALLELGLPAEAVRMFDEVLATDPANLEARLGKAAVHGRLGQTQEEIAAYRGLLAEDPERLAVRARLVAALIAEQAWPEARREIEQMLERTPDDPTFRFVHSVALERTHEQRASVTERERARALGLTFDREKALAAQLGLPEPEPRADAIAAPGPRAPRPPRPATGSETAPPASRPRRRRSSAQAPAPSVPRPANRKPRSRPRATPKPKKARAR
ncbi:MAG TPA: tetratricopeptide repeat protein [Thermoplasmata archaeon]|nr:tetratricopeptide repeat protein [Thermoplasmata archaeon]